MTSGAYYSQYREINNGAHRKAADLIGAPSLIWHQAFWHAEHAPARKRARAERLRSYLEALRTNMRQKSDPHTFTATPIVSRPNERVGTITQSFSLEGIRVKIRVEIHTEYVSITSIIDASLDMSERVKTTKAQLEERFNYKKLRESIEKFCHGTSCAPSLGDPFPDVRNVHRFLYTDVWEEWLQPTILDVEGYSSLGARFADLRGFVTCERYPEAQNRRPVDCAQELRSRCNSGRSRGPSTSCTRCPDPPRSRALAGSALATLQKPGHACG